jgi:Ran GTPase-activating protein (RanGAP) involved in mRNA processing and transport
LKLSYNNLGDCGAAIIASSLTDGNNHHQLSVLDLGFNSIGDVGCGYIALHCLAGNYNLQSLYLSGNQVGEKGALSIAGAILHGTSLHGLYLSANQIGPMGVKTIAGAIAKNESKILSMRLEANRQLCRSMETIHLASTAMESSGFLAIPGMLLSNSSVKSLCISDNNLDDQDMLLLSQALTQNKLVPLETLQLSFNQITCIGVECLMNALWGSKTLRELKLDNNKIQDRGAQLCAVVLTSVSLEYLDLSFNKVSTTGIKALMKNLSENSSLRTLAISGIPIDQNASKAVSYALAYNTTLRALHIDSCSTGYASQRHIVAGAVSNRKSSLRVLTGFLLTRKFIYFLEKLNFVLNIPKYLFIDFSNCNDSWYAPFAGRLVERSSSRVFSINVGSMASQVPSR